MAPWPSCFAAYFDNIVVEWTANMLIKYENNIMQTWYHLVLMARHLLVINTDLIMVFFKSFFGWVRVTFICHLFFDMNTWQRWDMTRSSSVANRSEEWNKAEYLNKGVTIISCPSMINGKSGSIFMVENITIVHLSILSLSTKPLSSYPHPVTLCYFNKHLVQSPLLLSTSSSIPVSWFCCCA